MVRYLTFERRVKLMSSIEDEALIKAIRRMNDPDIDSERAFDSGEDTDEERDITPMPAVPVDKDMERMQNDSALRQHLKIGSAFTGPKGVMQDYKFHQKQEKARQYEVIQRVRQKLSNAAMSSGWLQRSIASEEDEDEKFMSRYRAKRIAELQAVQCSPSFSTVFELQRESFVSAIEDEQPSVIVMVHLYDHSNQASRQINEILPRIAKSYTKLKVCRIIATQADPNFDLIALPAILIYRGGNLTNTLLRITDEIPGWTESGRCTYRDFEEYLILVEVMEKRLGNRDEFDDFSDCESNSEY